MADINLSILESIIKNIMEKGLDMGSYFFKPDKFDIRVPFTQYSRSASKDDVVFTPSFSGDEFVTDAGPEDPGVKLMVKIEPYFFFKSPAEDMAEESKRRDMEMLAQKMAIEFQDEAARILMKMMRSASGDM